MTFFSPSGGLLDLFGLDFKIIWHIQV